MKKMVFALSMLAFSSLAFADYNHPSEEVVNQLVAAAKKNPIVSATLKQSAKEVGLASSTCKMIVKSAVGEVEQNVLNGELTLQFTCSSGSSARYGEIQGQVFGGKFLVSNIAIKSAG